MPEYKSRKSQSYKKSKNSKNSKSGGRRRKHTMRKYRRGKKVMRGGAKITYGELANKMGVFGDEFNKIFKKPWNEYLKLKTNMYDEIDINTLESQLVDVDTLKDDPTWNRLSSFVRIKDTL